jgi:hypothetical protein
MKKNIVFLLLLSLFFTACEDFLNLKPSDSLVPENFYTNAAEVDKALNGVYQVLVLNGGANFILNPEVMTDNCVYSSASGSEWLDFSRGTLNASTSFVEKKWKDNYKGIVRANMVLDNLYNRTEMIITEVNKTRFLGEAHFLRAYFYTDLLLNYGGVPIINRPYDNITDYSLPRATADSTLKFILNDLNIAIEKLEPKPIINGKGKATKGAALFLKARILLFTGNYKEANKTINVLNGLNEYSLMTNFADIFDPAKENNAEVIFDIQYADPNRTNTSYTFYEYIKNWTGGYVPTTSLAEDFYDLRGLKVDPERTTFAKFFTNRDKRMIVTLTRPGDSYGGTIYTPKAGDKKSYNSCLKVRKYLVLTDVTNTGKRSALNIIVFRFADAKLMQAESIIEDDSLYSVDAEKRKAITLIDEVRRRAGLPNIEIIIANPSREDLREILRRERRVELAFENSRLYDIRRWRIAEEVMNENEGKALGYDPESYESAVYATYPVESNRKFYLKNYLWPIPQSEIDANTSIKENNPGY